MMQLDETNWKILTLLQEDARLSYADLGKQVGLTAPAIAERVRKLESAGIISGYHAQVDPDALGLTMMGIVHVKNVKGQSADIIQLAKRLPEVLSCDAVTGTDNYILRIVAKSRQQLSDVLGHFLEHGHTTSSIVLGRPVIFKPITKKACEG